MILGTLFLLSETRLPRYPYSGPCVHTAENPCRLRRIQKATTYRAP